MRGLGSRVSLKGLMFILALLAGVLMPVAAWAAGGENVELKFSQTDKIYLYASLGFSFVALVFAVMLSGWVKRQSPGDEKMQEVGGAIKEGALAYLSQQRNLMSVFVIVLGAVLFGLYFQTYGVMLSAMLAVSFLLGVLASYIAGYVGMKVAVEGNMRTAHAALSSYKASLEVAFRSGAVSGLVTVGMGLLGATLIFLFAQEHAMKLLVGFGFGGSLAALFMRVGGGIYTKAADVGADLVGKVEAGIPEDDPRNPATIADNVGDNVGDCAGMAADVFESYEVTLVAAIILGAATAAIFDQATWMRLVLFALMARGVGIIASIIGIYMVKGSDNIDADPLKAIGKGFLGSAAIAAVLTAGLAWWMMGGTASGGAPIMTSQLSDIQAINRAEFDRIDQARKKISEEKKISPALVQVDDIIKSFSAADQEKLGLKGDPGKQKVQGLMMMSPEGMPPIKSFEGYTKFDPKNPPKAVASRVTNRPSENPNAPPPTGFVPFAERYGKANYVVMDVKVTQTAPQPPTERGQTPPPPQKNTIEVTLGPIDKKQADELIKNARAGGTEVDILKEYKTDFYANAAGDVVIGIDGVPKTANMQGPRDMNYYTETKDTMDKLEAERQKNPQIMLPPPKTMDIVTVSHSPVEWWRFFVCILFGILMAFAFERMTDYYVSTHKKPVQEVANVSSAGPAPMIIQGFAYAKESSFFSMIAIVIALVLPLFVFPPAQFGGYLLSFYGIALVGLGLLATTGFILAMDTFGPISDNAQGVFEMSGAGHANPAASKAVQRLDAAGNTTKALTKGFAIATAVVAAVALFHAYLEGGKLTASGLRLDIPEIFLGMMIGGAAPYLFSAFSINAVGRASFQLIGEVRRQFRNDPGIMAGTSKPDYGKCVAIVTAAAQRELLGPGILAIALPVLVAFGFAIAPAMSGQFTTIGGQQYNLTGAQALGGFLAGAILSGQLLAVLLANSGGMWDNAKKLIEDGLHGGKGTEAHKAGVVCDTVGDPFKDTAGPAMNPLIKVMNLVALLLAPAVIVPYNSGVLIGVSLVALLLLGIAFWMSKKGSLSTELTAMTTSGGTGSAPAPKAMAESTPVPQPEPEPAPEPAVNEEEKKDA